MRLKILYVVPGTGKFAGIERVVDEVSTQLATTYGARLDVDVVFLAEFESYTLGPRPYRAIQTAPKTRRELMRTMRKVASEARYDLLIVPQVEAAVITWFACFGLGRKIVVHLHGNPSREISHPKAKVLFALMKAVVLSRLAGVFGTSPRQLQAFQRMFPSNLPHAWVPNPVREFPDVELIARDDDQVRFVNVGRYDYQKGQDLAVEAFARLYRTRSNARLRLVGYGADEAKLRAQIRAHGLQDVVSLEYFPDSPQLPLTTSDVYLGTSRWEGWSLAICEALRFGLPVVSTDCEFGPSDILTDAKLGRLVPVASDEGVAGLVDAMQYYCDHLASEREHAAFRRQYVARFSAEQVVHAHADAIVHAIGQRVAS